MDEGWGRWWVVGVAMPPGLPEGVCAAGEAFESEVLWNEDGLAASRQRRIFFKKVFFLKLIPKLWFDPR